MIKIGITGGIGCGKSYVARIMGERGVPVFDCDSEAKRLTLEHPSIREDLIRLLGPSVYANGGLNKPVLADYLFASSENAARVNAIIHPRVRTEFRKWALDWECNGKCVVALESAILYESDFDSEVDYVLTVQAPLEVRYKRVVERDNTTQSQVAKRIAAQLSDDIKCERADFVIMNDGVQSVDTQLDVMFSRIKGIKENK